MTAWQAFCQLSYFFSSKILFLLFIIMCMYGDRICTCECRCPQRPKVLGRPEAGVIGGYELPDLEAGNQIWVLCKSSMSS